MAALEKARKTHSRSDQNQYTMNGYIIKTESGEDLKSQMREQMREQYRNGGNGNMRTIGREYEQGYRDGYREGYEQAYRDDHGQDMQRSSMEPHELHQRSETGGYVSKYQV